MPVLIWLSACSYWHRVNVEMTRATLQFLDHVERPNSPRSKALDFGRTDWARPGHEDVLARAAKSPCLTELRSVARVDPARTHRKA